MGRNLRSIAVAALCGLFTVGVAGAASATQWVGSWATAELPLDTKTSIDPATIGGATLRQTVRLSLGGQQIRLRLSNTFGSTPLKIVAAHVARAIVSGGAAINAATDRPVTFDGKPEIVIPPGAEYVSDPIAIAVPAKSDLAISLRFGDMPVTQTGHPGSRTTSYLVAGDHVGDVDFTNATPLNHWYVLSAVDVLSVNRSGAVVLLGDSITDGYGTTPNGNNRWPDVLSARLNAAGVGSWGVLNFGIGGNRVLNDGLGPNALARFDRDVLAQTDVRTVVVFEGVNDLGTLTKESSANAAEHTALVERLIGAYRQIVQRSREHGVKAVGVTITPFGGSDYYHPTAENEADRQAVNAWIRAKGNFDAVIDFDAVLRDPGHPDRLAPAFDSGDHLHPSIAGYQALGQAIPPMLLIP